MAEDLKQSIAPEDLIQKFRAIGDELEDERQKLIEQIDFAESVLEKSGFQSINHSGHGIDNTFYYHPEMNLVFVVYYNKKSWRPAYATMDLEIFKEYFQDTHKKIALSERNDKQWKIVVSMYGTYIPLCHLTVGFEDSDAESVDHLYSNIWFNHKNAVEECSQSDNNRNRCNSKCEDTTYNASRDFRKNWWLLLLAELGYITMDEAMQYNESLQ